MSRVRALAVAAAVAAGGAGVATTGGAGAAEPTFASPEIGMQVLDLLCASKDGAPVNSPFTIARCQEARSNAGFEIERLVCEGLLGGDFATVPSPNRPKRTNWFCFPTTPLI